jgi:ATP-binding cassette subfamily C protein
MVRNSPVKSIYPQGLKELRAVRNRNVPPFMAVGLFSVFVNLLMLTGPIYMLQIYDRVLGSRSEETLFALSILAIALYALMGVLDWARGRVMARVGARFQQALDERVFRAGLATRTGQNDGKALDDLEAVQRMFASQVLFALFDMPWTPVFAAAIFLFHPWMGSLAVTGGLVLVMLTLLNQYLTRNPQAEGVTAGMQASAFAGGAQRQREAVRGMGMTRVVFERWRKLRTEALQATLGANDKTGFITSFTRAFRLGLQSAMLGLGAYLVLQGELTAGAMIAASILLGRALAPVELAIGQWPIMQRAQKAWADLSRVLETTPAEPPRTILPRPRALLEAKNLSVVPPGEYQASLKMVSFKLEPGQAMGVIGPSAAGKSTLAKVIAGIWAPISGKIRLDGATIDQYDPDTYGAYIGYLPQEVTLFDATIAENIARMAAQPDSAKVVAAAKQAGAHEMILQQPEGYDTRIGTVSGRLSGGQKQRIALARALYGDPLLLVLDEPNSNLDAVGSAALNNAIRDHKARGHSVVIMAHRPAAIAECDTILYLEDGNSRAFGPRDEVLKAQVKNVSQITEAIQRGTGA